ncbi:MAG: hypothetical protein RR696_11225, partial [Clostridia bacterium]
AKERTHLSRNTRTARFVQNTLSTGIYQLTAMLLGFITPRLMILYYGSEVNGLIVSVTEFLTYFKMVEAGLAAASIYALYEPLAKKDHNAISGIVSAARGFYNTAGWLFGALTLCFAVVYPFIVPVRDLNGIRMSDLSVMVLIMAMGISGILEFFTLSRYRVLLTADQRTYVVSLTSMASLLLSTALIVVLPYLGQSVIVVRFAASLTIVLRSILLSRYCKKHYPHVNPKAAPNTSVLSLRWDALYFELTNVFQQGAGVILATLITRDTGILSVYGVYHMVTVGLWGVLKMATTGIYSIFGNLLVSGKKAAFQRAYRDFECLYHLGITILFGVAAVLIVPFVNLYTHGVTDVNYNVPLLGLLIILEALTLQCKMPMDLMISSSGKFREVRAQCICQVVVTLVCGTALGLIGLGVSVITSLCGIIAGVCIGNLVRTGMQLAFVPRHVAGLPWQRSALRILRMFVTVAIIAAPCLWLIDPPRRFFTWVMYAVMLMLYATVVAFASAWLFDRKALKSLLGRLKYLLPAGIKS